MSIFRFKEFDITQTDSAMKVGTDAMLLGSLIESTGKQNVLDIGAGTGVLSLMIAQKSPIAEISAVEIDESSAKECAFNFSSSKWRKNLRVIQADFLDFKPNKKFDLVVSNPPYYQTRLENDDARLATARHERSLPKARMLAHVRDLLEKNGSIWLIVPAEDKDGWIGTGDQVGLKLKKEITIYGKTGQTAKRSIIVLADRADNLEASEITVRNSDGSYTDDYIELTSEYHFNDLKAR